MINKAFIRFQRLKTIGSKQYYLELKNYLSTAIKAEKAAFYNFEIGHGSESNNTKNFWKKIKKWNIVSAVEIPEELTEPDLINDYLLASMPYVTKNNSEPLKNVDNNATNL